MPARSIVTGVRFTDFFAVFAAFFKTVFFEVAILFLCSLYLTFLADDIDTYDLAGRVRFSFLWRSVDDEVY